MVRSVLLLRARDGCRDEVVSLFAELGILEQSSAVPGFLGAELQVAVDGSDELLVTATWKNEAAYDTWLASPVRERMRPALDRLLAESPTPSVYELVSTVP
jgi:quinol monooxygenase YgiN